MPAIATTTIATKVHLFFVFYIPLVLYPSCYFCLFIFLLIFCCLVFYFFLPPFLFLSLIVKHSSHLESFHDQLRTLMNVIDSEGPFAVVVDGLNVGVAS